MSEKRKKPILLVMMAYPGSGKTYFAEHFAQEHNFFHLNSDYIRSHIFDIPDHTFEGNKKLFSLMDSLMFEMLKKGISVIYDANTTKYAYRKNIIRLAKKAKVPMYIIRIITPIHIAEKRAQNRKYENPQYKKYYKKVSHDIVYRLKNELEEPRKNEKSIILDGMKPYKSKSRIVYNQIKKYL